MAKITIDTLPERSVEYLKNIPSSIERNDFDGSNKVFSALINRPIIDSELESLVGKFISNQSFAVFSEPPKMDCPSTFSNNLIPNVEIEEVIDRLQGMYMDSFNDQEDLEMLQVFFEQLNELETLYQKILSQVRKLQKG